MNFEPRLAQSIMATAKQVLAVCDQSTPALVYGFVRAVQNTLTEQNAKDPLYIISINIIHLCISYYFIFEKFKKTTNKYIELSDNDNTITNNFPKWDTMYGSLDIDYNKEIHHHKTFSWIFKVADDSSNCAAIGIDTNDRKWVNECFKQKKDTYSLDADGRLWGGTVNELVPDGFTSGDTIKMSLNVTDKILCFSEINDNGEESETGRFDEIVTENKVYCMAVYL